MKRCSQCDNENPSSASWCMVCRALVSEEISDKSSMLSQELIDANQTISLIKKSLATAHEQNESQIAENEKIEVQELKRKLLDEKEKHQKSLSGKVKQSSDLIAQLTQTNKQRKNSGLGWVFMSLFFVATFIAVGFYSTSNRLRKQVFGLNSKNVQLKEESETKLNVKIEVISNLENKVSTQNEEIESLRGQSPQVYKVDLPEGYGYRQCAGNFYQTDCYFYESTMHVVYTQWDGYGLTEGGWIRMTDLEKY